MNHILDHKLLSTTGTTTRVTFLLVIVLHFFSVPTPRIDATTAATAVCAFGKRLLNLYVNIRLSDYLQLEPSIIKHPKFRCST